MAETLTEFFNIDDSFTTVQRSGEHEGRLYVRTNSHLSRYEVQVLVGTFNKWLAEPEPIEVGDTVRGRSSGRLFSVVAIDGEYGWFKQSITGISEVGRLIYFERVDQQ